MEYMNVLLPNCWLLCANMLGVAHRCWIETIFGALKNTDYERHNRKCDETFTKCSWMKLKGMGNYNWGQTFSFNLCLYWFSPDKFHIEHIWLPWRMIISPVPNQMSSSLEQHSEHSIRSVKLFNSMNERYSSTTCFKRLPTICSWHLAFIVSWQRWRGWRGAAVVERISWGHSDPKLSEAQSNVGAHARE